MKVDLHLHTTQSDGLLDPPALVQAVARAGLDYFAVTDHDTMAAYELHAPVFAAHAARLIPGVELSTSADGKEIHILGYGISPACPALHDLVAQRGGLRMRRAERIVRALNAAGVALHLGDVLALATGASVGRAHIARALVASGGARDMEDAFSRYLGAGAVAYVPLPGITPQQAIAAVRACGGVAVLAHPARSQADALIPELRRAGLQGIEAYAPSHDLHEVARYRSLAAALDLAITAGSDFHQATALHPQPGVELEADELAPFLALLAR
ncbi:MAG: PHP domain-containing protein [Candidatus Eremiobacteraeota bacterium]|nr:PHP domain-containing protein [Candidatus Eremiobacteraeota bacterium]